MEGGGVPTGGQASPRSWGWGAAPPACWVTCCLLMPPPRRTLLSFLSPTQGLCSLPHPPGRPWGGGRGPQLSLDSPELVTGSPCPNLLLTWATLCLARQGAVPGTGSPSSSPHPLQPSCPPDTAPLSSHPFPASLRPSTYMGTTHTPQTPTLQGLPHVHAVAYWPSGLLLTHC